MEGYDASTPSKPHDIKAEDVVALYMFENNQGTNVVEGGETAKQPAADKKEFCSYIEITADYRYYGDLDTQGDAPSNIPNLLAGTIFYRFYLGKDITSSFEVMRNTHYQLTLNLSDWAGLVEDGKITNGSYKPGNTNVSWRVDTDLREIDEGFVDTELNLPIGGCRFDVIVATSNIDKLKLQYIERGVANYPDEVETGNNDTRWIFVKKQDGWTSSGNALNGNFDAKNNEDGTYTLSFYAKPWTKTDIEGIVDKHPDLNNMDAWLKSGYRYTTFEFTKSGGENATLTVRQWLPIPVMEPGLSGDKPADANLYYSRFDIANGNELRWGPTAYDAVNLTSEGDNHGDLVTTGLGIDPNSDVPSGEFNPEYGFHNQVAFFITDRKRSGGSVLDFNAVLNGVGTPSMLDYATFISANAEEPGTDEGGTDEMVIESASEAHGQHHYALASKEEWEKIERYGVLQNFLPIPYWTSNMEGTESYVYIYGSGGDAELRPRSKLYRGRMVYHKNNDAHF